MGHDGRHDDPSPMGRSAWSRDDAPEWRSELPDTTSPEAADYTRFGFKELGSSDVMNAYLDGELSRRSPRFRAALVGSRKFRADLAAMEELDAELGRHTRGPDLTNSIMDRLSTSGKFAAPKGPRFLTMTRMAAAASVFLALSATVIIARTYPSLFPQTPTPIASVVHGPTREQASVPSESRLVFTGLVASPLGKETPAASTANAPQGSSMPLVRGVLAKLGQGVNGAGRFEVRASSLGSAGTMDQTALAGITTDFVPTGPGLACVSPERLWANPDARAWRDALAVSDLKLARSTRYADPVAGPALWSMDLSSAPSWRLVPVDGDAAYSTGRPTGRIPR